MEPSASRSSSTSSPRSTPKFDRFSHHYLYQSLLTFTSIITNRSHAETAPVEIATHSHSSSHYSLHVEVFLDLEVHHSFLFVEFLFDYSVETHGFFVERDCFLIIHYCLFHWIPQIRQVTILFNPHLDFLSANASHLGHLCGRNAVIGVEDFTEDALSYLCHALFINETDGQVELPIIVVGSL